jgi:glycosyltransferase involved in cell wall biosynthesis
MACGCALVAAANQGVYEFAGDGETALLAPVRQPEALADKLVNLIQDDELRKRLAEAGYRKIQEFTWEKAVTALESLLLDN